LWHAPRYRYCCGLWDSFTFGVWPEKKLLLFSILTTHMDVAFSYYRYRCRKSTPFKFISSNLISFENWFLTNDRFVSVKMVVCWCLLRE
jgi:hypothetical protein